MNQYPTHSDVKKYEDLPPLSAQQEQYVLLRTRGMTPEAAANAVGLPSSVKAIYKMHEDNPAIDVLLVRMRDEVRRSSISAGVRVNFTKDDAAILYLEAHAKAEDSMSEIRAVDSLVKLFGLNEPEKREIKITTREQLKEMADDELAKQMGEEILLDPEDYVVRPE